MPFGPGIDPGEKVNRFYSVGPEVRNTWRVGAMSAVAGGDVEP